MAYENVNLWFAKDEQGNIVMINEVHKEDDKKYYCPICGSEVNPKQGDINSWHFAHFDGSKCSSETRIHWWIKNKLIEVGTKFTIKTDKDNEYICKEVLIEQSYEVDGKVYNPDITVLTECGNTVYFEIANTNKKKIEDYLDIWIGLNNIVVEVSTKDLINTKSKRIPIFNALFYNGKCFNVKKGNTYYDTIGKYKENLLRDNECDIAIKERVKKLDWFWRDITRYNNNEVDIDYMINLIDNIENKEYSIVMEVLRKPKCSQLYYDYRNGETERYIAKFELFKNEIKIKYDGLVLISDSGYNVWKNITIQSKLRNRDEWNNIGSSSGGGYSIYNFKRDVEYINGQIKCEIEDIKYTEEQNKILNNKNLLEAIEMANKKYKDINKNYDIKLEWNGRCGEITSLYHVYINFEYHNYNIQELSRVDITSLEISHSNNTMEIFNFISSVIDDYRDKITPIKNINIIEDIIINIKTNLAKIKPIRRKYIHRGRVRYAYDEIELNAYFISEEKINIYLDNIDNSDICIKSNEVYYNDEIIMRIENDNYEELKNKILEIFSQLIRKERYRE